MPWIDSDSDCECPECGAPIAATRYSACSTPGHANSCVLTWEECDNGCLVNLEHIEEPPPAAEDRRQCPVCAKNAIMHCNCCIGSMRCARGHEWYIDKETGKKMPGSGH